MKKDIGLLICELDELAVDFDLISHTLTAVEEGISNGANKVNPLAICMPVAALKNSVEELMLLKDEMFTAALKEGKADSEQTDGIEKTTVKAKENINPDYELCVKDFMELKAISKDEFELINNSFLLGYVRGEKSCTCRTAGEKRQKII